MTSSRKTISLSDLQRGRNNKPLTFGSLPIGAEFTIVMEHRRKTEYQMGRMPNTIGFGGTPRLFPKETSKIVVPGDGRVYRKDGHTTAVEVKTGRDAILNLNDIVQRAEKV